MFSELLRTGPLDVFASYTNGEIECFRIHIERIEKLLQQEQKDLIDEMEERMQRALSEQSAEAIGEEYGGQHWLLAEKLPQIQRQGDLIAVFSLFESRLDQLCRNLESDSDSKVRLRDLANKGIERAKAYLKKVAQIRFPSDGELWNEIKHIQRIRNIYVHSAGVFSGNEKGIAELEKYAADSPYLDIRDGNVILIRNGFISHCLDIFSAFFYEIAKVNKG